ncbi:hypothetical protein OJAV_G00116730 [Oryzias javanicus]|uniref:Uncharacterized protein n=1 Tax=Oryzias javanicus TaxID=123683 RepID=A0A437CSQ2_ORYJA|nr:hypothetical protein OJAV_G00116730 [Oryzias javanicus]
MSSDKNPEVVGCDASIMKNVWEIRARDYNQKLDLEQERLSKSALPVINQDWANRMTAKKTGYKRVEKKAKPTEDQAEADVWKSKQPMAPRVTPPRAAGAGVLGRTGVQGRGSSTATPSYKDKKGQGKTFSKLQLLASIDQTQPSNLVWGKAWKYNKSADGGSTASLDWGQPWMFVNHQPSSEGDKPWSDEPRIVDPQDFHMWRKPDYKNTEPKYLDVNLPMEDWQRSWNQSDKMKRDSSEDKNSPRQGFFTMLIETQRRNEALSSSEWMDSWQSIKTQDQHDHATTQRDNLLRQSDMQENYEEISPEWKESWMLANHHGDSNFKSPLFEIANSPEWTKSWRIAQTGFRPSDSANADDLHNHGQKKDSHALTTNYRTSRQPYKDLTHLYTEFQGESQWNNSWQVLKNNSKPCEDIDKTLKAAKPEENDPFVEKNMAKNQVGVCSADKPDPLYDQLKHEVIYQTKWEMMKSKLLLLAQLQKTQLSSDWKESWKTLKHRMREERRRLRSDLLKPLFESEKQESKKPNASEWNSSWKYTCQQLNQQPDRWQEGWSTVPPVRRNMQRHPSEFSPEEFPKNGPAKEQIWKESWKFSRSQHRSEAGQSKEKVPKGTQHISSYNLERSCDHERRAASTSDWQESWMVSETQYHHDQPSLTQWREAWRCSIFHTQYMAEQESKDKWVNGIAEIQPQKNLLSSENVKVKMSRSFDEKMFRQRYPEKDWKSSWSARPLLNNQSSFYGSGNGAQRDQMDASRWGHWFRIANPMPHLERPWLDSCSNPIYYSVMWQREKKSLNNAKSKASITTANFHGWGNSHCFMQNGQRKGKSKSREPMDPRVIFPKKIRTKKQLYSEFEKQKQSDRKFAGCHLLGKTQPRPKKGRATTKKPEPVTEDKFFEEWVESWRFLVQPETLKTQRSFKPLSGWNESWKLLIPPY